MLLLNDEPAAWIKVALAARTYLVALLMVSTFRYWSFKEVDIARRHPVQTLLVVVLGIMIVATNHELFLFLLFAGYALSGPCGGWSSAARPRRRESWEPRVS